MLKRFLPVLLVIAMMLSVSVSAEGADAVRVPVLMYHSINYGDSNSVISPENFREHLEAMKENGFTPVSLEDLVNFVDFGTPLPEKPVCITFDDGYRDNYTEAFPMLEEYGFKATIFAIVSSVGKDTYKDTAYAMNPHFSFEEAREMAESGLVSIQSHSFDMHQWPAFESSSNPRQSVLPLPGESLGEYVKALESDFVTSKTLLEATMEQKVIGFAYPLGRYNAISDYILKKNGVRVTVTITEGTNYVKKYSPESLYNLNRYNMCDEISAQMLLEYLNEE